ncbi:Creatine kinase S-type, mitochondrial [Desmophyllum pertusum]|uniref:creatine kinase n=1 Tax=Desmophyllum pertusum TaxID=174260 RepID=A0A9X0D2Z9_9CNID|nr:Creatine kinase S-type, mitochondrial [Desmophyllum pertusum]
MGNGYEFMRNVSYGFLASRPQELGICLRVGLNVKLPLIAKDSRLASILKCLCLQRRKSGINFPDARTRRARLVFEVSNVGRIGISEVDLIQQVVRGVNLLIEMEELLTNNHRLDSFISKIVKNTQDS